MKGTTVTAREEVTVTESVEMKNGKLIRGRLAFVSAKTPKQSLGVEVFGWIVVGNAVNAANFCKKCGDFGECGEKIRFCISPKIHRIGFPKVTESDLNSQEASNN